MSPPCTRSLGLGRGHPARQPTGTLGHPFRVIFLSLTREKERAAHRLQEEAPHRLWGHAGVCPDQR